MGAPTLHAMTFERLDKDQARAAMGRLVEEYRAQAAVVEAPASDYSEAQVRLDFVDTMLRILGWDVNNEAGKQQRARDVVVELTLVEDGSTGRPDYLLRAAGKTRLPLEAKRPSIRLSSSAASAAQARSYGLTLLRPAAVLTNFSETVIYDCTRPTEDDADADTGVLPGCRLNWHEYVEQFDVLWTRLSYECVASDRFYEIYEYKEPPRGESPFDVTFLAKFGKWRRLLAQSIADRNGNLNAAEVGRRTQRLLNALLFLRVCEDRDIGRYEDLLTAAETSKVIDEFRKADQVFNAGLFSVLEQTDISDEVLLSVVRDLYWPSSKFAFALLQADTLGVVYEQYLAERVVIDAAGKVRLEAKPELTHSGGVVPTPVELVRMLIDEAFNREYQGGTATPSDFTVLDPACGSGIFLVEALNRLIAMEEAAGRSVGLPERARLAREHLFGVDIDGEAVEVAKLSLLLVVLGQDLVEVKTDRNVLPDLSNNLRVGNSLIGPDFDRIMPTSAANVSVRADVAPFDWRAAFPGPVEAGGFKCIVGNPPYVRIQVLADSYPAQLTYFQDPRAKYKTAVGSFDIYMLFLERCLSLLSGDGSLALVVKSSLVTSPSAAPLRQLLAPKLTKLVHLGSQQVFAGRQTYPCLIVSGATDSTEDLELVLVTDGQSWLAGAGGATHTSARRDELSGAPWVMASAAAASTYGRMDAAAVGRLGDPGCVDIFVGVQTSADDIYYVQSIDDDGTSPLVKIRDAEARTWQIERALVRPVLRDRQLAPYGAQPDPDYVAIFPYVVEPAAEGKKRGRATVISPEDMSANCPNALRYFEAWRSGLISRSVTPDPGQAYWAYGRSQNLTKLQEPKIINRTMSLVPQYVPDRVGLVVPGGGDGGPYTLLRPHPDSHLTLEAVIALLSHPVVDAYIAARSREYRGAYVVHRKATLAPVPVPPMTASLVTELTQKVQELQNLELSLRTEKDTKMIASLRGRRTVLTGEVQDMITDAYGLSEEDLKAMQE